MSKNTKKKLAWAFISLLIAGFTIYAVSSQSKNFSLGQLMDFVKNTDKAWLAAAFFSMFGFIWFEGIAIISIVSHLGYQKKAGSGLVYSGSDIYFSAITPSASGGQPVSAWFMLRDGLPFAVVTAALLINLVMYTLALLFCGFLAFIFGFRELLAFSSMSKILIGAGTLILLTLCVIFYLLLKKPALFYRLASSFLDFLERVHLKRLAGKVRKKMNAAMEDYNKCAELLLGKSSFLARVFFWNVLQRMSHILVSFCIFMAAGYGMKIAGRIIAVQSFVAIGSNCVPIPGAMGAADYMMLDGFGKIVNGEMGVTMEILCRGISFYASVIMGLLITGLGYIRRKVGR